MNQDITKKHAGGRPPKPDAMHRKISIRVDNSLFNALRGVDASLLRDALRHCVAPTDETFVAVKREMGGGA